MRCQHKTEQTATEETSGGSWRDYTYLQRCDSDAPLYRQCGRSRNCKTEIGYCAAHGGDERAQREMVEHHKAAHPREGD